ncbi:hypothetical protein [Litoreibacter ascidiaceicola]|uniref:hypothetical protein n=1 Tax=Litoreibacter ascidiaceicola TaxID=1486859 RepID=UPI0009347353|nr:hypothetical protein [Litoreibacter ascidiaceicola]
MRQRVAAFAATIVLCLPCWADTRWIAMTGAGIEDALRDRGLIYDKASQHFYASTRTRYAGGRDSWGIGASKVTIIAASGLLPTGGCALLWSGARITGP